MTFSRFVGRIPAEAILTFETGPQAIFQTEAYVALIPFSYDQLVDVEIDVVSQILQKCEDERKDELVKVSLCYTLEPQRSVDPTLFYRNIFDFLIRGKAKYYFQPNQRDEIETRIMQVAGVASKTKNF